ncbi:hypothetical protein [Breznakiella homolactica]|uniref:Outer membrane protein beta-barrel domain-containing protein n=1 Tax=Breznakiella homolactica TaxID=2798577 RepID=A0A7T7XJV3_9SPIR|nr:hypothetical protein [Breznakiella homolactica]QQO07749.1 hypothetical protein JFL75_12435 [Breznakiella homolactica]
MKKLAIMTVLLTVLSFTVCAQGLYFDIGLGFGKAWTKVDGEDFSDSFKSTGVDLDELGIDLGLKLGYGPFGRIPLYIAAELSGVGHRFYDSSDYIQFNSYLIGGGIIFYPIRLIQIAGSFGYSFVSNDSSLGLSMYDSKGGFAGNVSVALDIGRNNHGLLIGAKFTGTSNTLEVSDVKMNTYMIGLFVKYAYRHKV